MSKTIHISKLNGWIESFDMESDSDAERLVDLLSGLLDDDHNAWVEGS